MNIRKCIGVITCFCILGVVVLGAIALGVLLGSVFEEKYSYS
ncbi:MAG: hypothetical protein UU98_C0029G0012 [Parcubacteria group bacterium GW2011_GWD2_42_14]|nr:MAG: hypothetical protein UU98_C0029G0012 [Parcubacteria group bacterium GW2011_GWD2_42_14]